MLKAICILLYFALVFDRGDACVEARYRPKYHLAPPKGWMNDPNGFSRFKGNYHLFYQYNPLSSQEPGIAHWGHAVSRDLFHWEDLPIAMYPDKPYDRTGVFSGSALIENGTMYLYYTGNVNYPGETPDHIQKQALAFSVDGINVTKYENNPIIEAPNRQPNIRDPKVWKHGSKYYMVLGNSFNNDTLGRVLLYTSDDKIHWTEVAILDESDGFLGYMWECPDFFELDGLFVLLFSPQGMAPEGDKYRNLYQTGYIVGTFDYVTYRFRRLTEFKELDHGHDFYATQTIKDDKGRRLLVAWNDMWEQVYPERDDGWTGQMTLPRTLRLSSNMELIQRPVREVRSVIQTKMYEGPASSGTTVALMDNAARITVRSSRFLGLDLRIGSGDRNGTVRLTYEYMRGMVTLDRGGSDGVRRTEWRPRVFSKLHWEIYVDSSSIELFCGDGEVTFSSRYFPNGQALLTVGRNSVEHLTVHSMEQAVALPEPC